MSRRLMAMVVSMVSIRLGYVHTYVVKVPSNIVNSDDGSEPLQHLMYMTCLAEVCICARAACRGVQVARLNVEVIWKGTCLCTCLHKYKVYLDMWRQNPVVETLALCRPSGVDRLEAVSSSLLNNFTFNY